MNYGFIYCLGNQAMPGIYKIGMTERAPSQRCMELSNSTSAPLPFDLLFYGEVENPSAVEREIHAHFDLERVNCSREFFRGRAEEYRNSLLEWCDSVATTNMGEYYMSVESILDGITAADSDAERVRIFTEAARLDGIVMWREGDRVQFNVTSMGMVPHWVLMTAATSKSILLQHLPTEFRVKPKRALAIVAGTEA